MPDELTVIMEPGKEVDLVPLLQDLKLGNEAAFCQVFNNYYGPLCYFAENILHDKAVAEDKVQETLLKVWQKRTDFKTPESIRSFLYITARNACYDELDKNKVRQKHQKFISYRNESTEAPFLDAMIKAEVVRKMNIVLDTLPEQCRRVIRLTFDEGKTPKEIAEELGISVSTVNNQKMRGLLLLRQRLSDQDLALVIGLMIPSVLAMTIH